MSTLYTKYIATAKGDKVFAGSPQCKAMQSYDAIETHTTHN